MKQRVIVAAALGGALTLSGCQSAMSMPNSEPSGASVGQAAALTFHRHSFQAICYDTIGCKVAYNGRYQIEDAPDKRSDPPKGSDYQKAWGGVEVGIRNFPKPAIAEWKSLDGQQHRAAVDLAEIFNDQSVRHRVPESEIPQDWQRNDIAPDIYLEIIDRTINVYMKAHVATRTLQIPGNKYSAYRDDLIKVWSKTY